VTDIRDCWLLDADARCPNMVCCQLCPLSPTYWRKPKDTGLLYVSFPAGTVGLSVADGRIVDWPRYAGRMVADAEGSARKLLDTAKAKGAKWKWIPDRKATA
jgi:hypothetical protein